MLIPRFLLPPSLQQHVARAIAPSGDPVEWRDNLPYSSRLYLKASSWAFRPLFDSPAGQSVACPFDTRWSYSNRRLPRYEHLATVYSSKSGRVCFDDDVLIPVLSRGSCVWMSHTPMEYFSLRGGVRAAKGRVIVGGLGLGYQLREIAKKKNVASVVVYEHSAALVDWYGRRICQEISEETKKPVEIRVEDAYALNLSECDSVVFDIWQSYREARSDPKWRLLRETALAEGTRIWGWGA